MKRSTVVFSLGGMMLMAGWIQAQTAFAQDRRISINEYRDKMKGGWLGQMAGVAFGAPTEFKMKGKIIPEAQTPKWKPETINESFGQDDLYVDMTFLRTLEVHGLEVSIRQAGIDWANSGYPLWHANEAGRSNLRKGIAPPDSGHPQFNKHADDIDYQIEADFSGLVSPGLPNTAIALGERFGRLMNYGDGLYAGQFMGGLYAEAFFEKDAVKMVEAGLRCVPESSQFHECISDVLKWYREDPVGWEKTWQKVDDKYQKNAAYRRFSCDKKDFNIDAKINAAYVIMGLLYGKGDLDRSMAISCRCGQDSDCNPSSTAGVLFTTIGFAKLPATYKEKLDESRSWIYTAYNFPKLIAACEKVAREAVVKSGGRIEKDASGEEFFVIPPQTARPSKLEQCWEPGPVANSRFTEEEMAQIKPPAQAKRGGSVVDMKAAVEKFASGWAVANCGSDMSPGIRDELGREGVLVTHPLSEEVASVLSKQIDVPAGKKAALRLTVGHHPQGDWVLVVRADGKELLKTTVGKETAKEGWLQTSVDLSGYAGKSVKVELLNQASGWSFEAGYWARIAVQTE